MSFKWQAIYFAWLFFFIETGSKNPELYFTSNNFPFRCPSAILAGTTLRDSLANTRCRFAGSHFVPFVVSIALDRHMAENMQCEIWEIKKMIGYLEYIRYIPLHRRCQWLHIVQLTCYTSWLLFTLTNLQLTVYLVYVVWYMLIHSCQFQYSV